MNIEHYRSTTSRYGASATMRALAVGAANRVAQTQVLRCLALTTESAAHHELPEGYRFTQLWRNQLTSAVRREPELRMDAEFIEEAFARGDRCYGATCNGRIASFAWYATGPTPISDELLFQFGGGAAYMYKACTLPAYRGRRIHCACVTRALGVYASEGYRALICYIESTNFASLRSHRRAGFRDFGWMMFVKRGGRDFLYRSGCDDYGVGLVTSATTDEVGRPVRDTDGSAGAVGRARA